jgi:hypothetical protein
MTRGSTSTEEAVYSAVESMERDLAFDRLRSRNRMGGGRRGLARHLHLVLRLESYLDRKISIDLITPRKTPLQLTQSLLQKCRDHDDGPYFITFRLTSSGASEYSITPDSSITNRGR